MVHSTKRLTTEEFVSKALALHDGKYDYSKTEYKRSHDNVIIICPIHGEFQQIAHNHLRPSECPECSIKTRAESNRSNLEEFIVKAKKVHGDKYDYSQSIYISAQSRITILCVKHGVFEQIATTHLDGEGCYLCGLEAIGAYHRFDTQEFIDRAELIHGEKYNYSKIQYVTSQSKVIIICPTHGEFEQVANSHLRGRGCPVCYTDSQRSNTEEFVARAKAIHDDKYDYSKTEYVGVKSKLKILCSKHGVFEQKPDSHLAGSGCPKCSASKAEIAVEKYLKEHNYKYNTQVQFDGCRGIKKPLPFDFQVTLNNGSCVLLEVDGDQHRRVIKCFKEQAFANIQRNDAIKTAYCIAHSVSMIRLEYTDTKQDGTYMLRKDRIPHVIRQLEEALAKYDVPIPEAA